MQCPGLPGGTAAELAHILTSRRTELAARRAELGGFEMMRAYSDLTDALVRWVYGLAFAPAAPEPDPGSGGDAQVAIAAVGGYGRREMSPYSDIDVAFIAASEEDESVDQGVKRAFRTLMDVAELTGLKLGYSFRRVDDVEQMPLETRTALLDARCVAGNTSVFDTFTNALANTLVPAEFVIGHVGARSSRSRRANDSWGYPTGGTASDAARGTDGLDTPFVVEPDIKEGCGGLRDFHTARWIAQVTFGIAGDQVWEVLRLRSVLADKEIDELLDAAEFLARTRNFLHFAASRPLGVLTVERQGQVAEVLGFGGAAEFMSAYYRYAHRLRCAYLKVASACLESDLGIEQGIVSRDGRLHILDSDLLEIDRAAVVRVFRHAQTYGLQIGREALSVLAAAARSLTPTPDAARTFLDVLAHPGAAGAIRSMADTGLLQAMIPLLGDLMYTVPADSAHRFTVGEHSIRAVEQLEALRAEPNEQFAAALFRVQDAEVLVLATLLHDIGKLDSSGEHAKTGASRAAKIAAQLGLPRESCGRVEFLVRHHLLMADTARLRDLARPKTIRDFVAIVRDQQLLDMLFLLTVSDLRAVGSRNWSQVQIRFLLELHERASAALRSPAVPVDAEGHLDRHRARVRRELSLANVPPDEVDEHCACMPVSYLLNTPPEELAAHIAYVRSVRGGSPVVEIKDDRGGHFTLLTVAAMDRPGLLSDIAGVLHALGVDIHAAQVFTRSASDEIAIDTLYVDFEGHQLSQTKKWQIEGELMSVLSGGLSLDELLTRLGKGRFRLPDRVSVALLENLSDHETVIEIRTADKPGLLYYLTRTMSELGWNIHSARVATWDREARDVFYVTDRLNRKLGAEQIAELRSAMGLQNSRDSACR